MTGLEGLAAKLYNDSDKNYTSSLQNIKRKTFLVYYRFKSYYTKFNVFFLYMVVLFNGISTFLGYFIPNPSL